jgi:hypothetical protein
MTSAINPTTISTTFPVEGQDNPSQGFRSNFAAIASNFTEAAAELTDLQSKAIVSAQLGTGVTTPAVNNLLGSTISNGLYQLFSGTYYSASNVSGAINIDLSQGAVQKYTLSGNTTFTFSLSGGSTGFPTYTGTSGVYSNAILLIQSNGTGVFTPTFATASGTVSYDTGFPTNPNTGTTAITVGGEQLSSVAVANSGSGYTGAVTVGFSGGTPITNAVTPAATATYTVVGASCTNLSVLSSASTFALSTAVTATAGTGATATLTFANTQASGVPIYAVGQTIIVQNLVPTGYNGVWTVTASTATTVSYTCSAVGSMTSGAGVGIIQGGLAGNGYAVGDQVQIAGLPNTTFTVNTIATTFTATTTNGSPNLSNVYNFTNLVVGMVITGVGIPANTQIGGFTTGFPGSISMVGSNGSAPSNATASGTITITYTSTTGPIGTLSSFPAGTLSVPFSLPTSFRNVIALTGTGTGAKMAVSCGVGAINVVTPGSGYTTTAPSVTISGGNGTGAQGTAILTSGTQLQTLRIEAWTVNGGGNVYLRYLGKY